MSESSADRNLLLGILALQMDFISRDELIGSMHAWVLDKGKSLAQILCERKALSDSERQVLEALVQKHVERHENDPARSLAAVGTGEPLRATLATIGDADLRSSLARLPAAGVNQGHGPPQPTPMEYTGAFSEPTQLGRARDGKELFQPRKEVGYWRVAVAPLNEDTVTREHALLEPLPGGRVRLSEQRERIALGSVRRSTIPCARTRFAHRPRCGSRGCP
jgi:eukaryotic-like serine/threonine-protein kinase